MNPTITPEPSSWRQLSPRLWVGRNDDRPIGEIEQGYRFTFIEPSGTHHPGYISLAAAQEAATGPIPVVSGHDRASMSPRAALIAVWAIAAIVAGRAASLRGRSSRRGG